MRRCSLHTRIDNRGARDLLGLLDGLPGVRPLHPALAPGDCPLTMPLIVPGRDRIVTALQRAGIEAVAWWSGYNRHLDWSGMTEARHLKDNLLTVPVHQYLGPAQMQHIAAQLRAALAAA